MNKTRSTRHFSYPDGIQIDGEQVPVEFKVMKRKSVRLNVTPQGHIEVRLPPRYPADLLLAFLNQHTQWLIDKRRLVKQQLAEQTESFNYFGKSYQIELANCKLVTFVDDKILLPAHKIKDSSDSQAVLDYLYKWLREQAREYFQQRIDSWWPKFADGAKIDKPILRIKKMKTRWGSLSQRGYINMNMLLMHYPVELIEMVVVHELCHSHYFDHSANFYRLMAKHLPDYRLREKQLDALSKSNYLL